MRRVKNKNFEKLRKLIVDIYLKNYVILGEKHSREELTEKWLVMSCNEIIQELKRISEDTKNHRLYAQTSMAPVIIGNIVDDLENPTMYGAYSYAYYCFYNRIPTIEEQNKLRFEYKNEKVVRGISIPAIYRRDKPMRTHDRESFFKYCTAETLKKNLSTMRFRWSSPKRFNDPFDHLFRISMEGDPKAFKEWFVDECRKIVFGLEEPKIDFSSPLSSALILLRSGSNKLKETEFVKKFDEAFEEGMTRANEYLESVNKAIWDKAIQTARVFCVSEGALNFLMWAHYAGEHSGAVIEIKCIEELDTPLCAARKIEYQKKMPKLGSYREIFLNGLGLAPKPTHEKLFYDLAFVKSEHWSYEEEWRCITYREEEGLYSDYLFYPDEIATIYLGCRMKDEDKDLIIHMLKNDFKNVQVFQMQVDSFEYKLNYVKV